MARRDRPSAAPAIVAGVVGAAVLLGTGGYVLLSNRPRRTPPRKPEPEPLPPPAGDGDTATDDETALARMLRSETGDRGARIVIGWITMMRARRLKRSIFRLLTGESGQYGHLKEGKEQRYASTFQPPTAETRKLARLILSGAVQPSRLIRELGVVPWVEWLRPKPWTQAKEDAYARAVLHVQKPYGPGGKSGDFGGIKYRIAGTRWYLYKKGAPIVGYNDEPGGPSKALEAVPTVHALDDSSGEAAWAA